MTKKETAKRYFLFIIGLMISGIGVGFTKYAELGVSPISSVPNIMSIRFPVLTIGNYLIIWNCILILGQVIILKKDFKPIQLLQVPLSFVFGYFTDFGVRLAAFIPKEIYIVRLLLAVAGVITLGLGISLAVIANVIMNSGEAFVKAVSDKANKEFGNVKIAFDISNVVLALVLSLIFFEGKILGMREGTVIAAVFTGITVKLFTKLLNEKLTSVLKR